MKNDSFFLSKDNPLANIDQIDLEGVALRLLKRPEVQKARAIAEMLWRNVMAYPAREQMDRFENMIDEYVFHYVLRAANGDAIYPKVLRFMEPPSQWFGHSLPGSRWGGNSPNFIYRMVPIEHGARYEISGKQNCPNPPSTTYSLTSNNALPATSSVLDSLDIQVDATGKFVITIDAEPASGRLNHLQTRPGTDHLLIRDALGDWLTQTPNSLRVKFLDTPHRAPLTAEELAQSAAKNIINSVYYAYYCTQSASGLAANELRPPMSSGSLGGMPTQWGTKSNLYLESDEALIVTANGAGAQFRDAVLCDMFFMSTDFWQRTSSLNMAQMAADDDGRFTFVISQEDPGVHNWLDTGGLKRTIFGHRWQSIPSDYVGEAPIIESRAVKIRELSSVLPRGIRRIDEKARREQIAKRMAGYEKRFSEI